MLSENIGKSIQELRKEKKVTQEELALAVGVSTQAVSKWECGGTPDIDLLPKLADYFDITIDKLFDRNSNNYANIEESAAKYIASFNGAERNKAWFSLFWEIQKAVFGQDVHSMSLDEVSKTDNYAYSLNNSNGGISWMSLPENRQYAFLTVKSKDSSKLLLPIKEYCDLFTMLSNIDYLNCLFFLYKREDNKDFTEKLLINNLKVSEEKAKEMIDFLLKYSFIMSKEVELNDEILRVYSFLARTSFLPFIIFAKEIIKCPNSYRCYNGGQNNLF